MRDWRLGREELPSHILAADARFCTPNYVDDQIWELNLSSGEPTALTLRTTYGLRVRNMRMFPRFSDGDAALSDPAAFAEPPEFRRFLPNYALVSCAPFEGLDTILEYWVVDSRQIGGRIRLINSGVTPRTLRLEWVAVIVGADAGAPLVPEQQEGVHVLAGAAGNLRPVVFLSGGAEAQSSPTTALSVSVELLPGVSRTYFWGHAAAADADESFRLARGFASRRWEEEVGRIEMINTTALDIRTGDPAWDAAFALGQTAAYRLIHGPTEHLPHASFVHTRLPDQGYSLRGDGGDYDHLWNGQNVLETWHLVSQFLPAAPELARGLLENFLHTQDEDGCIDWQPSLNGKTSGVTATPMLCSLAWRIHELTGDRVWLVKYFPRLQKFVQHWFAAEHDRDRDGIPEWDHPMQTGFEDNPFFAHWQDWAQGADISDFESPSLAGLLYRECSSLIRIAREIHYAASIPGLEEKLARLRASLETSWDGDANIYRYRDRETHASPSGMVLTRQQGPGVIIMTERKFSPPARLSIRIRRTSEGDREPVIILRGTNGQREESEETIGPAQVRWSLQWGTGISRDVYRKIASVEVQGVRREDEIVVSALDYRHLDQTLLAPLWAGVPDAEVADRLVKKSVINPRRFWRTYGLAACATVPSPEVKRDCDSVWIPWNCLVGDGLVDYGYAEAASELVSRMMDAITTSLQKSGSFRKHYDARTGEGIGERNAVLGLPPLDLFLRALGVQIYSIWRVRLSGRNPFPWAVTIRFRGLEIQRRLDATEIRFPNGEVVVVETPEPTMVEGKP